MRRDSLVEYVGVSSVRTDVVTTLCERACPTDDLLSTLDASESAVYDALSNLESRGVVAERPDGWRLTGVGRLVGDTLERRRALEDMLARDPEYWTNHDVSALPAEFRCRLPEIGEYEVVRTSERNLDGIVRRVVDRVRGAESCEIISPIYHREYERAMPDDEDARLVVSEQLVDDVLVEMDEGPYEPRLSVTPVRVASVTFSLGVADDWLLLTVPEPDGAWPDTMLVSETEAAVQWGRELYDRVWADATPIRTYISDH